MKKNILIIDDFSPLLEEICDFLKMENYNVFAAENGAEGIRKIIEIKPDIILCDIMMPELNGYQVYEEVSKIPSLSKIPFIFVTAKASPEDYEKGLELGAIDYITKPFEASELLMRIKKHLVGVENKIELERLKKELESTKQELQRYKDNLKK